ncbi:MAG: transposase [Gammaproteobacteria bacterium]|nr:transposase [Gammaproteobacteria bacterium]
MSENTSLFSVYAENLKSVGGRTLEARQFAIVEFNRTMVKVIPWAVLEERLVLRYYDGKRGRPPALEAIGLELKRGTSVDSTLIKASSSTKNQAQSRDEEMSSTRKGEQYHFGMKLPVGVDSETGRVHSMEFTTARVHDSQVIGELLNGEEHEVYGDKA